MIFFYKRNLNAGIPCLVVLFFGEVGKKMGKKEKGEGGCCLHSSKCSNSHFIGSIAEKKSSIPLTVFHFILQLQYATCLFFFPFIFWLLYKRKNRDIWQTLVGAA